MSDELDLNKIRARFNIPIELEMKVHKKFAKKGDFRSTKYVRALEESTRDVILTKAEYARVGEIIDANRAKRLAARKKRAAAKKAAGVAVKKGKD